jgi:hypothetical protein
MRWGLFLLQIYWFTLHEAKISNICFGSKRKFGPKQKQFFKFWFREIWMKRKQPCKEIVIQEAIFSFNCK